MAAKKNSHKSVYITLGIILAIVLFVVVLVLVIRSTQVSYSHKVTSITLSSDSGPVSPEFQQSQILTLNSGNCQYTVTKVSPEDTKSVPCNLSAENFQKIIDSYNTYNVSDKLQAAEGSTATGPIGGKRQTISVQYQDGTVITATVVPSLKESIQPFLDDITLYVPQTSQLQI